MSGEYLQVLRKRALNALKWAERAFTEGDYDTALREAEYAVQLYIKALIYRVLGEEVRGHNIRELLSILASALMEEDLSDLSGQVIDFARTHRRELAELSDAHTRATYGLSEYSGKEAKTLLEATRRIMDFLKGLEGRIFDEKPWRRLLLLRRWREIVAEIAGVIKGSYPDAEVYLTGGAAENRLTVNSDIDILVVFRGQVDDEERVKILEDIWEKLEGRIPAYYPLHIIVLSGDELGRIGGVKKRITP